MARITVTKCDMNCNGEIKDTADRASFPVEVGVEVEYKGKKIRGRLTIDGIDGVEDVCASCGNAVVSKFLSRSATATSTRPAQAPPAKK